LNRTLCNAIGKLVQLHGKEWNEYLPSVLFAYRTMQQNSTKFTPFYLTYGRQAITPLDLKLQPFENEDQITSNEIIKRACTIMDKLELDRITAQQNVERSQQKQKDMVRGILTSQFYKFVSIFSMQCNITCNQ
jgi:hypothetical protein